ncbi:uncharacterized protein LOC129914481 [Episyrphus balteatus]|uniref:uncharacterized protein LOC129914481 n=1 Tax=Episyrphus balteatus TaxID=286459 RepID=UPI0024858C7F|nr:uncharacterized protein LOC129914481 [Episyrphus balteatus]
MEYTGYQTEQGFDLHADQHNNQLYPSRLFNYLPVERNIHPFDHPDLIFPDRSYHQDHIEYRSAPEEQHHQTYFCRKRRCCHLNICADSNQAPSKLPQPIKMDKTIEPKTKPEKKKKTIKEPPSKQVPKVTKPKPSSEPKEDPIPEPAPKVSKEQYLSCCSSCCVSTKCSCCGSSCLHKHRNSSKTDEANCEEDEDPSEEFFCAVRESMENAVKKAFDNVFGRYFACCISKIDSLTCRVERTEYLLKKMHKDLKFRICVLDRSNSQQFQYLCDQVNKDKYLKSSSESQGCNRKMKCKPPKNWREPKQAPCESKQPRCVPNQSRCQPKESSSSDNCRRDVNLSSKSKCGNKFGQVKSQYWNCGQQSDNNSAENSYDSGQSCEEVVINETDLKENESKNKKTKSSKIGNNEETHQRKRSRSSDGISTTSKKKNRVVI